MAFVTYILTVGIALGTNEKYEIIKILRNIKLISPSSSDLHQNYLVSTLAQL
jgi:hypothetical protein